MIVALVVVIVIVVVLLAAMHVIKRKVRELEEKKEEERRDKILEAEIEFEPSKGLSSDEKRKLGSPRAVTSASHSMPIAPPPPQLRLPPTPPVYPTRSVYHAPLPKTQPPVKAKTTSRAPSVKSKYRSKKRFSVDFKAPQSPKTVKTPVKRSKGRLSTEEMKNKLIVISSQYSETMPKVEKLKIDDMDDK